MKYLSYRDIMPFERLSIGEKTCRRTLAVESQNDSSLRVFATMSLLNQESRLLARSSLSEFTAQPCFNTFHGIGQLQSHDVNVAVLDLANHLGRVFANVHAERHP